MQKYTATPTIMLGTIAPAMARMAVSSPYDNEDFFVSVLRKHTQKMSDFIVSQADTFSEVDSQKSFTVLVTSGK